MAMTEPDLAFISRQLERVLLELRHMRNEMRLLRDQVQIQGGAIERLDDTIRMDVLERLRQLENRASE
jgi:hypothetical protein